MADAAPDCSQRFSLGEAIELLATGDMDVQGLLPRSSNYTFFVIIKRAELQVPAVYKPSRGERPLWDFPTGTLAHREVAAHAVSEALGWMLVPPTVLRDGPHGTGMVQLYIHADPRENYFSLGKQFPEKFKRMALFDALINNADRKAGHCLRDDHGHIWAIDHGVCFHEEPKLRTVIWLFAGEMIPAGLLRNLRTLREQLKSDSDPATKTIRCLLSGREVGALARRADELIEQGRFPIPDPYERYIPWPPV